jgi:ComF family protein
MAAAVAAAVIVALGRSRVALAAFASSVASAASRAAALASPLADALEAAAALVWPPACALCGARTAGPDLCDACAGALARESRGPRCRRCDATLPEGARPRAGCRACRGRPLGVSRVVALGPHEGALRRGVRRFKFHGRRAAARPLGRLLGARLREARLDGAIDVVVPVPATPSRLRERGYDPAALLAAVIARALGAPLALSALTRRDEGPEQKRLERVDRWRAARAAYAPGRAARASLADRRVLLVDDVVTSGATIAACASACRAAGATRVIAASVSRQARRDRPDAPRPTPKPRPCALGARGTAPDQAATVQGTAMSNPSSTWPGAMWTSTASARAPPAAAVTE